MSFGYQLFPSGRPGVQHLGPNTIIPADFTARFEEWDGPASHPVELDIAIDDGRPVCQAVRVERHPKAPPLTGTELRRIPLAEWVGFASTRVAMTPTGTGAWGPSSTEERLAAAAADVRVAVRRRRVTDEVLRDAANLYLQGGADLVAERLHVSMSQAFRYVQRARAKGYVPAEGGQS